MMTGFEKDVFGRRLRTEAVSLVALSMMIATSPAVSQVTQTPGGQTSDAPGTPTSDAPTTSRRASSDRARAEDADGERAAEIVVTGSSIRGVAPIGSNLVSVGRDQAAKIAAVNATELTNTIPAITQSGSAPVGENQFSYYAPSIHGLGGSASNTTLVIVDGMRVPGGGTQFGQTDPNIIPSSALQRVEVLADGASSVYGSDAVAGVINYITRRSFEGIELTGRYGFGDSFRSTDVSGIWGTKWSTGGVYVAGAYSYQSPLHDRSRDFISKGDYRDQGGRNTQSFSCSPATIRTTASGNNVYLSPSATTTVLNVADNAPCNLSIYGDAIQSNKRANGLVRVYNTFGDKLTVSLTGNYNYLVGRRDLGPGTLSAITAFGPGSGAGGQINPFYQAPAGEPGATREILSYAALKPDNAYGSQSASNDTLYVYGTAEYEFSDRIQLKWSNALGHSRSSLVSQNIFCSSCAILALNGTTQSGGSTTASSVPGTNLTALNLPLTTANALDVWQPNLGRTSQAVISNLYNDNTNTTHYNDFKQSKLELQGSLFDLPAGPVRLALGGEYMWLKQRIQNTTSSNIGSTGVGSIYLTFQYKRKVYSGYAELVVPVVSENMEIPLVRKFDVNVSGRIDHYDDVGTTRNPKIAANWEVIEGIRLRGNYATGFVAPPLASIGVPSLGYRRAAGGVSGSGSLFVPLNLYPEARQLPGCQTVTTATCQIGTALNPGISRSYGTGPGVVPQTGKSWSIGVDFNPTFLPQLRASVTLWNNKFVGGVDRPDVSQYLYSSALHNRLIVCPTGCTTTQVNNFANVSTGGAITGALPTTVYFLANNDLGNVINLRVQGIDANATLRIPTSSAGIFTIGGSGTYYTKFKQDFGDAPFNLLSTSGSNATFPAIRIRARAQAGWELGGFSFDTFLNYTGKYRNWSNASVSPITVDANNAPNGGGDLVKANVLFDMHAEYKITSLGFLDGGAVYVDAKNVFDKDPPFYSGNTGGIGLGGQGYNGIVSNPLGRIISVGFRANF